MATEEDSEAGKDSSNSNQGGGTSENRVDTLIQKGLESSEITEEIQSVQHSTRQNLVLEIPTTTTIEDEREDFLRINMPLTPPPKRVVFSPMPSPAAFYRINQSPGPSSSSSSRNRSNFKAFLPKLSLKIRNTSSQAEKAAFLALEGSPKVTPKRPLLLRTLSLKNLIVPRGKNTTSLPVTPIAHSNPESMHGGNAAYIAASIGKGSPIPIHRSLSVPALNKEGNTPVGGVFRIIPTTPRLNEKFSTTPPMTSPPHDNVESEDGGEDIPEEEAVCRICMVELGEGADTLKLECSCKGELSLAHQECAVKWFSIKGNRTCDVCKQVVQNLPVTLQRVQTSRAHNLPEGEISRTRVWQEAPVLVIVSMLAYFCFLEQLLVSSMGSGAVAMSLPFSCVLGLIASMTSTTMVSRKYVWLYATVQFGLVVLTGHLFHSLIRMQAVLAILLATITSFGTVMVGASILTEIFRWRRRSPPQLNQQHGSQDAAPPPDQFSVGPHQFQNESQSQH